MPQTLKEAVARGELPARQSFGHDELQERADEDSPEYGGPDNAADERSGREITAADPGRGQQQAGAYCRERQPNGFLFRGAQLTL